MVNLDDYLDDNSFVSIPKMLSEGVIGYFYPNLLPNQEVILEQDFPQLKGRIYLDSGATSQVPASVIREATERRLQFPRGSNHSKNSQEARRAHQEFEEARKTVNKFFNASNYVNIFTSGTTDSSNWIASRFPFEQEDLLLYTDTEHNSQILTARNFANRAGAKVKRVRTDREGHLDLDDLRKYVQAQDNGKILLNLIHASNVTGLVSPVAEIRRILGDRGFIYLDMAQSAGHMPINLDELDVDFAGCSAHKMYGPTGIGAMFVNHKSKRFLSTEISGGSAVQLVSRWFTAKSSDPAIYEPGTQDLEGAYEWKLALEYLSNIGMDKIHAHDTTLGRYFVQELAKIPNVRVYGPKEYGDKVSVVTFNVNPIPLLNPNHDYVARELDERGISVRDGCFCAHIQTAKMVGVPLIGHELRTLGVKAGLTDSILKLPGAVRASFAFYNTLIDTYTTIQAIRDIT